MAKKESQAKLIQELIDRQKAEQSFYEFVKQAWHQVEACEFIDNWHIEAMCDHLQACYTRDIRYLLCNLPPRCGKSILFSVLFPAWVWIKSPYEKFFYASYSRQLSIRDSIKCRRVMESVWFKSRWGDRFKLLDDQNTKIRFDNDKSGYRLITSGRSAATGEGGDFAICDDPNSAKDIVSTADRESRNEWFDSVWSTRGNNPKTDVKIVVQQRLHEGDQSGHILSHDDKNLWTKLILPMEYVTERKCKTIILPNHKEVWEDPRTEDGELLWPERIGPDELDKLKQGLGNAYRISGQLQQNPTPAEGAIINRNWYKWWKYAEPPEIIQVIQSWDTALDADIDSDNAYSSCTTWGLFEDDQKILNVILLGCWRGKLEYPDLRKMAQRLFVDYRDDKFLSPKDVPDNNKADRVLIEDKATGMALIRDLQRAGIMANKFNPNKYGDKITRVRLTTHLIEAGRVWVPAKPPKYIRLRDYAEELVENCASFPAAASRDIVDTQTQVLLLLQQGGYITNPSDDIFTSVMQIRKDYRSHLAKGEYY